MTQLERITEMERRLDASAAALRTLSEALEQYRAVEPDLKALFDYYFSPQWLQDFDDDAAGKLPQELKRGVLSEDAVYDLLTEQQRIMQELQALVGAADVSRETSSAMQ